MRTLQAYFEPLKASKAERLKALAFVHKHPNLHEEFFELAVHKEDKRPHIYASWVWELFIQEDIERLTFYCPRLLPKVKALTNRSMRRVHSKIIWLYLKDKTDTNTYQSKKLNNSLPFF